jgi:N utilization substance protein A
MPYLTEQMLVTLGKAGIRTLDDLADLATDELVAKKRPEQRRQRESNRPEDKGGLLADYGLSEEQGNEIIMAARAHWFEDEAPAEAGAEAGPEAGEDAVAESSQ